MGCYYLHKVRALSEHDIETLLLDNNLIKLSESNKELYELNLKKCSLTDYEKDARVIQDMQETWETKCIDKKMLYTSRTASDMPAFYVSKAFPKIVFEEVNSFEGCADGNYEIRKWLNGECIGYSNGDNQ